MNFLHAVQMLKIMKYSGHSTTVQSSLNVLCALLWMSTPHWRQRRVEMCNLTTIIPIYFPKVFFVIFQTSLTLILISCEHNGIASSYSHLISCCRNKLFCFPYMSFITSKMFQIKTDILVNSIVYVDKHTIRSRYIINEKIQFSFDVM
jgi:hypothetical protein